MSTLAQRSTAAPGDGLGYRVLGFDKKTGDRLEMLRVRPQFSGHVPFDVALRNRWRHLMAFSDPAFASVRQIDRLAGASPSLVIVSHHVLGVRLAEVLSVAESFDVRVDIGTALGLVRQLAAAIATLHGVADGMTHGCIGPERLLLTADGRLLVSDYILGSALDAMQWSPEKFWRESRIAVPATGDPAVFDRQTDIMQIGLLALALLEGRTVYAERDHPPLLAQRTAAAREAAPAAPSHRVTPALTEWLARALQGDRLSAFTTIAEALTALDQVIDEGRYDAQLSTVAAFVTRCRDASPDLKPRDVEAAREAERPLKAVQAAILAAGAPRTPLLNSTVPPSPGVDSNSPQASSQPVSQIASLSAMSPPLSPSAVLQALSPSATVNGRTPLRVATRAPLPAHGGGAPIELESIVDREAVVFEPLDEAPESGRGFTAPPLEQMNSLLDMEVLVGMLRQPRSPFEVQVDQRPLLLVDPVRRSYRLIAAPESGGARSEPPPIGELVARLRRGPLRYRDATIDDETTPGAGFPIQLLLWNLGLVLQSGDLLPQVKARGWVQLARWPDFGRIRSDHAQLKMSALLTSRAFGIDEVFDAVDEPRPRVIAFLNACALCGLFADVPVENASTSVAHAPQAGRGVRGLMQRLRGALGIGA